MGKNFRYLKVLNESYLGSVVILASVGHPDEAAAVEPEPAVDLIAKWVSIDRLPAWLKDGSSLLGDTFL